MGRSQRPGDTFRDQNIFLFLTHKRSIKRPNYWLQVEDCQTPRPVPGPPYLSICTGAIARWIYSKLCLTHFFGETDVGTAMGTKPGRCSRMLGTISRGRRTGRP